MDDKENPMEPIKAVHWTPKKFMRNHPSYDKGSLQDWLNLLFFITSKKTRHPTKRRKSISDGYFDAQSDKISGHPSEKSREQRDFIGHLRNPELIHFN